VAFTWPGNVRQLVNAARRLTVTAPGREIREEDIPADLGGEGAEARADDWCRELEAWATRHLAGGGPPLLAVATERFERTLARAALERVQGRRQEAAKLIGWGRNTLTRKLRELGLE
jgi:two-component system nitrogen regulation response regulator GlnG